MGSLIEDQVAVDEVSRRCGCHLDIGLGTGERIALGHSRRQNVFSKANGVARLPDPGVGEGLRVFGRVEEFLCGR